MSNGINFIHEKTLFGCRYFAEWSVNRIPHYKVWVYKGREADVVHGLIYWFKEYKGKAMLGVPMETVGTRYFKPFLLNFGAISPHLMPPTPRNPYAS